jgi:hypothetical protein
MTFGDWITCNAGSPANLSSGDRPIGSTIAGLRDAAPHRPGRADVLGERTLSGPIPVAELCGETGIALLERQ